MSKVFVAVWLVGLICLCPAFFASEEMSMPHILVTAPADGLTTGPVRLPAQPCWEGFQYLRLSTVDGQVVGVAQRDQNSFVWIAPAMPAGEQLALVAKPVEYVEPQVVLQLVDGEQIQVWVRQQHFTTYWFKPEQFKPYLYPVMLDGKYRLTRGFPIVDLDEEPENTRDHFHHESWWTSHGDINGANFWHMDDKNKPGRQIVKKIVCMISGPVFGQLTTRQDWVDNDGTLVCEEERTYTFYNGPDGDQLTDLSVTFFTQPGQDLVFGDTKEGGICAFRMNPAINEAHGNGLITNSNGEQTEQNTWGKPAKWMDYSGQIDDVKVGITVMDHPDNPRHPTRWHIRGGGLYGANIFGLSYFLNDKSQDGSFTIPAGEQVTFQYRVYAHMGESDSAEIEQEYLIYTNQPAIEVKP